MVDGIEHFNTHRFAPQAGLIAGDHNPVACAIEPCDCLEAAGDGAPFQIGGHGSARIDVDDAVPIENDQLHVSSSLGAGRTSQL